MEQKYKGVEIPKFLEYRERRVLTLTQLAKVFKVSRNSIYSIFSKNRDKYTMFDHYYLLKGVELDIFKFNNKTDGLLQQTHGRIYIFTKEGVFLFTKILNTDNAREIYKYLVDNYFNISENSEEQPHTMVVEQEQLLLSDKTEEQPIIEDKVVKEIQVIEYQNKRTLTTQQLSQAYGTETQTITNNFNRNKERYTVGKHYYCLEDSEKREFIDLNQIDLSSKNAQFLYLWTEKGALLHAKSLNTDKAWEVYDQLVDSYFNIRQEQRYIADKKGGPIIDISTVMYKNALTKQSELLFKMSEAKTLSSDQKNILIAKAAQLIAEEDILPLPKLEAKEEEETKGNEHSGEEENVR
ncbi:MAG: ORF6N domain-containing protein [Defluviitaleaceae bacterium]|nr:ORF6N domain-containing protein [Defluviitaleaceae bacterium]